LSDIPDFDVVIPTSRNNQVWIFFVELDAEDSIGMTWLTSSTTFKLNDQTSCLFIINPDNAIRSSCGELSSIGIIIDSQKLIQLIINGVEKFSRSGMPMLEGSICIHRNDNVLCNSLTCRWSPPNLGHRHLLLHLCIQNI